jgi:hypothetical protein
MYSSSPSCSCFEAASASEGEEEEEEENRRRGEEEEEEENAVECSWNGFIRERQDEEEEEATGEEVRGRSTLKGLAPSGWHFCTARLTRDNITVDA